MLSTTVAQTLGKTGFVGGTITDRPLARKAVEGLDRGGAAAAAAQAAGAGAILTGSSACGLMDGVMGRLDSMTIAGASSAGGD